MSRRAFVFQLSYVFASEGESAGCNAFVTYLVPVLGFILAAPTHPCAPSTPLPPHVCSMRPRDKLWIFDKVLLLQSQGNV